MYIASIHIQCMGNRFESLQNTFRKSLMNFELHGSELMKTGFSFLGELDRISFSLSSLWKFCSRGGLLVTSGCLVRLHITLRISSSQGQGIKEGRGNGVPLFLKHEETVFHSYTLRLIIPDPWCRISARRLRFQAHLFFELT